MARVFISYRRSQSKWAAGRLYDRLADVIGRDNLFFDVSNIEPGEDFVARIRDTVGKCDVLLALIGPDWATAADASGRARLLNPRDLVRLEVAAALERRIRVIPILFDGAAMPDEAQLPEDLVPLLDRNAHEVSFAHFDGDLDSFVRVLQRILTATGLGSGAAIPKPAAPVPAEVAELPFTLSIETLGGVATALIKKGSKLPAQHSETFSTAEDNQKSVEVTLAIGERGVFAENVRVGRFQLDGLPPAPRGGPQITITTSVDRSLILTVTAEEQGTKRRQVLDAVDLTRLEVPAAARVPSAAPEREEKAKDSASHKDGTLETLFGDLFGSAKRKRGADVQVTVTLTPAEAASGTERLVTLNGGRQVTVRIPPGVKNGNVLRLRGEGEGAEGTQKGDAYITLTVG